MIQLVVLGNSYNWQKTNMGMQFASEVFVNMMQVKRYPHKISELIETLKGKMATVKSSVSVLWKFVWNGVKQDKFLYQPHPSLQCLEKC